VTEGQIDANTAWDPTRRGAVLRLLDDIQHSADTWEGPGRGMDPRRLRRLLHLESPRGSAHAREVLDPLDHHGGTVTTALLMCTHRRFELTKNPWRTAGWAAPAIRDEALHQTGAATFASA
jgi:hypothetical protein